MSKWMKRLFSAQNSPTSGSFIVKVKCKRCGEVIEVRIKPKEEANPEFGDMDQIIKYEMHKEILGKNCPNLITLYLEFSPSWSIISKNIENGEIIEIK